MHSKGSLRLGYVTAWRQLPHLIAPIVLLSLPVTVIGWLTLPLAAGSDLAVISGEIMPVGRPGTSMLVWTAITLSYLLAAGAVAGPAMVILAVGRLLGCVVPPGAAMRMAARRWRTWLVLMGVAILMAGVIGGAGLGLVVLTEQAWPAIGVMVLLSLALLPMLLAVPAAVLEDWGAFRAIGRAYWLTRGYWLKCVPPLLIGVFVVPGLMSQIPLAMFFGMVLAPFQASMIAVIYLRLLTLQWPQQYIRELIDIATRLPDSPQRPPRVLVVAGLLLPALVYGGAVLINPLDWPDVTQTRLDMASLESLHLRKDGRLLLVGAGSRPEVRSCGDAGCVDSRAVRSELTTDRGDIVIADNVLPDGRLVMASRTPQAGQARLALTICDDRACSPVTEGPELWIDKFGEGGALAVAPRPDGGLVVAMLDFDRQGWAELSFIFCHDLACSRSDRKSVAKLSHFETPRYQRRPLALAIAPDGTPIAAHANDATGGVDIITCDVPTCNRARVTQPAAQVQFRASEDGSAWASLSLAVRRDGRPLIAYRDIRTTASVLLNCRTKECAQADRIPLTGPSEERLTPTPTPALAVDGAGRARLAVWDMQNRRLLLVTCVESTCSTSAVGEFEDDPGATELTVDGRGRPVIAWSDIESEFREREIRFHTTVVLNR
ncbi:hypothetical protein EDD27_8742 [Nonomuraea polychroma]|uniref:Uncharacterized protein n=2 Tax=Nonomuraea polychroma TaxID=46176 RepID=A0A438MK78_9ACTN|nr:hypothetical protein EDD27_8742 [Nonomuraea polychroma]